MAGLFRNLGPLALLDEGDDPVHPNASVGSFNNTGRGTQNVSGCKNTGYMAGDGNGAFNQNHFGNVLNNNGFHNAGTQNTKGLINNTGHTNGNGNGSFIFGGFNNSTNFK
ncbi:hypothetical protein L6164_013650 [Bauhinia variegata]|uniref:Uncharacterized protein n=1 Tax=Bauhinia variegata TaxID=167791 RepID=A0ACB9NJQ9_BAUVA|nr:hypothetical protein L6164_013650 [Bauhinia variegata]